MTASIVMSFFFEISILVNEICEKVGLVFSHLIHHFKPGAYKNFLLKLKVGYETGTMQILKLRVPTHIKFVSMMMICA